MLHNCIARWNFPKSLRSAFTLFIITGATLGSPVGLCPQRDSRTGIGNTHVHIPRGHDGVQSSSGLSRPRMGDGERPRAVQGRQNGELHRQ